MLTPCFRQYSRKRSQHRMLCRCCGGCPLSSKRHRRLEARAHRCSDAAGKLPDGALTTQPQDKRLQRRLADAFSVSTTRSARCGSARLSRRSHLSGQDIGFSKLSVLAAKTRHVVGQLAGQFFDVRLCRALFGQVGRLGPQLADAPNKELCLERCFHFAEKRPLPDYSGGASGGERCTRQQNSWRPGFSLNSPHCPGNGGLKRDDRG
jgi:hypothetical protein